MVNGKGFSATYEEAPGKCGGNFISSSGAISSPNYPNNYGSMQDCEWYIDVGEGKYYLISRYHFCKKNTKKQRKQVNCMNKLK